MKLCIYIFFRLLEITYISYIIIITICNNVDLIINLFSIVIFENYYSV